MTMHEQMTQPDLERWTYSSSDYRRFERTTRIDDDDEEAWQRARADVMTWKVKTRSGFAVEPDSAVSVGDRPTIVARVLGFTIHEPVEVVAVLDTDDRVGFAYRTLPGHPVDGEEAFLISRTDSGIELTIRSLTRPASQGVWRWLYPLLRVAQIVARRRYFRALAPDNVAR